MNTNMKELNLNEMEMINGGWKWKDVVCNALFVGTIGAVSGGVLAGLPGAAIGGTVGAGIGAAVCFM